MSSNYDTTIKVIDNPIDLWELRYLKYFILEYYIIEFFSALNFKL